MLFLFLVLLILGIWWLVSLFPPNSSLFLSIKSSFKLASSFFLILFSSFFILISFLLSSFSLNLFPYFFLKCFSTNHALFIPFPLTIQLISMVISFLPADFFWKVRKLFLHCLGKSFPTFRLKVSVVIHNDKSIVSKCVCRKCGKRKNLTLKNIALTGGGKLFNKSFFQS